MFPTVSKDWTYSSVRDGEGPKTEDEVAPLAHDDVESESISTSPRHMAKHRREQRLHFLGHILCIALIVALLGWNWSLEASHEKQCLKGTSSYSPLLEDYTPSLREVRFNGTLDWPSPYRGPPNPEIDKAWNKITMIRPLDFDLTEEQFLRVGKDPETAARNAPEYGGGYFLVPEWTHQLHCVNLLRKVSHFKFAYYSKSDPDFTDDVDIFKVHIDHCVEQLRQFVMCHADMGVITAHWIEQRHKPWPDFNTNHMCRDFNEVVERTKQFLTPKGTPFIPRKPDGAKALASPP